MSWGRISERLAALPVLILWAVPWQCSLLAYELAPREPVVEPAPPVVAPPPVAVDPAPVAVDPAPPVPARPTPVVPAGPKREEVVPRATLNGTHAPPRRRVLVAEAVVLRTMDRGRAGFVRCFERAIDADPLTTSFKIRVRLELDAAGKVTAGTTDARQGALGNCLLRVAYTLPFPAPGAAALVELPLFYRGGP